MTLRVAEWMCVASTALLLVYGADVATKFLPIDAMTRGIGFGASSVAMLTAAYFTSRGERSALVTSLLLFCGAIIIVGMVAVAIPANKITGTVAMTIGLGSWVLALGILKGAKARAMRIAH